MTTFVRRVPSMFDQKYWTFGSGYMERELGAVLADEHARHEKPESFVEVAGDAPGQRKDMPYCFAPYDGLRGLNMRDVVEFDALGEDAQLSLSVLPPLPQKAIEPPAASSAPFLPAPPSLRGRSPLTGSNTDDKSEGIPLPALALLAVGALLLIRKRG